MSLEVQMPNRKDVVDGFLQADPNKAQQLEGEEASDPSAQADAKDNPPKSELNQREKLFMQLREKRDSVHRWAKELSGKIPDWVPLIKPYLDSKFENDEAISYLLGWDILNSREVPNWEDRLKKFSELELKSLINQGKAAFDALLLFGTAGTGTAAEVGVSITAKGLVKKFAAESIKRAAMDKGKEAVLRKVTDKETGDGAFLDLIPEAIRNIGKLFDDEDVQKQVETIAALFEKLNSDSRSRETMEKVVADNKEVQEMKDELRSAMDSPDQLEAFMQAMAARMQEFDQKPETAQESQVGA